MPDTEHTAQELREALETAANFIASLPVHEPEFVNNIRRLAAQPTKEERFAELVKGCLREYESTDIDSVMALAGIMTFESLVLNARTLPAAKEGGRGDGTV